MFFIVRRCKVRIGFKLIIHARIRQFLKVSSFKMSDEDSPLEEDENESLVYVEFEGTARSDVFSKGKVQLDMIGLDMEHPIMRVNGRYYEGTYEDAVGTYMFFEKDKNPVVDDPVFDVPPKLKYSMKTRKILKMKRVFVKPRLEIMEDSNYTQCEPNLEILKEAGVPPAYQEDALNLWNEMRKERLEALNEYLEKQKIREEKRQRGIEPDSESDEDSPFAMYKTKPKDPKESPVTEITKSTVIDPGPSTSKDHIFPSNYGSNENAESISPSLQIKNQGYLGIYSRQRRKMKKKIPKVSDSGSRDDEHMEVGETADDDNQSQNSGEYSSEFPEQLQKKSEEFFEKSDSDAMSQTSEANSQVDDVEYISDKKLEKQRKRTAKIREISERLKKTADEIKSKANS